MREKVHGSSVCVPSCVGPIPPLVITKSYFRTKRLLASILQTHMQRHRFVSAAASTSRGDWGLGGGEGPNWGQTFRPLSLGFTQIAPCGKIHGARSSLFKTQRTRTRRPRTIQSHSQSNTARNSANFDRESSRSKSRLFSEREGGKGLFSASSRGTIGTLQKDDVPDDERRCRFDPAAFAQWIWRNGRQLEVYIGRRCAVRGRSACFRYGG